MIEAQKTITSAINFKTEFGENYDIPAEGSLGLLALGYIGLMAWREKRMVLQQQNKNKNRKTLES